MVADGKPLGIGGEGEERASGGWGRGAVVESKKPRKVDGY